jgi:hypothetical protein
MSKGIELPINVLVIVAVAVIVLLGIVGLYLAGFGGPAAGVTVESVKTTACQQLIRSGNCGNANATFGVNIGNFDANKNGVMGDIKGTPTVTFDPSTAAGTGTTMITGDNLGALCVKYYGATWNLASPVAFRDECNTRVCGCSV